MGATSAKQYQCNLCRRLVLSDRGNLPTGWQEEAKGVLTACEKCVATILRDSVDALIGNIAAACKAEIKTERKTDEITYHIIATRIAERIIQQEIWGLEEKRRDELHVEQMIEEAAEKLARETPG